MFVEWWNNDVFGEDFAENMTAHPTEPGTYDSFFMSVAKLAAGMSKCASRGIGAVLVRDRQILSFGYNGAPAGVELCQSPALKCPRKKLGIPSGQGLEMCPAQHAEENCIHNAAKNGISTEGATLYCYCGIPCQRCAGALINAGVVRVVCLNRHVYDSMSQLLFEQAGVEVVCMKETMEDENSRVSR